MPALAVKYRPNKFEDVSGQTAVVSILKSICESDAELDNRNFLLIGPAGTGKTTSGRIMANMLNQGKGSPIEVDAASYNGVDAVRQLVKDASSFPIGMKYKVYILDEAHTFSQQAWQVFLKTLEEGAGKSIFIFCTTNPEKIPATILSRVQTFQLSKLSLSQINDRLLYIIKQEQNEGRQITYEDNAVNYIAKLANGGMRDAITLLDKALSYSEVLSMDNLLVALNIPSYDMFFALVAAYAKKNNEKIAEIVHDIYNSGINFVQWFERFHSFVMNIVKYILLQDVNETMIPDIYVDKLSKYTYSHCNVCLRLANKLITMISELKSTQYLEEVALTHLCFIKKEEKEGK